MSLVVVAVVFFILGEPDDTTLEDNFLALAVVGFIKLRFELGVALRPLAGLPGVVGVKVAVEVSRKGLDLAALLLDKVVVVILGVEVVGFKWPFRERSWLLEAEELERLKFSLELLVGRCKVGFEPT